jgi:hypothetical protein
MIDTPVGILNVPELEVLISLNLDVARRYQAIADDPEAEAQTRQIAERVAVWRRARARYFHEECAETERVEAANDRIAVPFTVSLEKDADRGAQVSEFAKGELDGCGDRA